MTVPRVFAFRGGAPGDRAETDLPSATWSRAASHPQSEPAAKGSAQRQLIFMETIIQHPGDCWQTTAANPHSAAGRVFPGRGLLRGCNLKSALPGPTESSAATDSRQIAFETQDAEVKSLKIRVEFPVSQDQTKPFLLSPGV